MIRVVISDFGGVLTNPLIESFLAYQDISGVTMEDLAIAMGRISDETGKHPLFELEKGLISEADFAASMHKTLSQVAGREIPFHGFSDTYFANLHPNERMIALMAEQQATKRMAMLTNNVREWEPKWRAMLPVDQIFELIVDSAFVGCRKPEREIYEITFERLQKLEGLADLKTGECIFIDDIAINCEAAQSFGFQSVQFKTTEQAVADLQAKLA